MGCPSHTAGANQCFDVAKRLEFRRRQPRAVTIDLARRVIRVDLDAIAREVMAEGRGLEPLTAQSGDALAGRFLVRPDAFRTRSGD